jgi:hypothetical protein
MEESIKKQGRKKEKSKERNRKNGSQQGGGYNCPIRGSTVSTVSLSSSSS